MTHGSRLYSLGITPGSIDHYIRFNERPATWDFSTPLDKKDTSNVRSLVGQHYDFDVNALGSISILKDPSMGNAPHILVQDEHGEKHILHTRYAELSEETYQIGQKVFTAYGRAYENETSHEDAGLSVQKLRRNTEDNLITQILDPSCEAYHYAYLTNYVEAEPSEPSGAPSSLNNISYAELGKTVGIMRRVGLEIAKNDPAFTRQIESYTDDTATLLYKHGFNALCEEANTPGEKQQQAKKTLLTLREWPEFMALINDEDVPRFINHFNGQPRAIMAQKDHSGAHITSIATVARGFTIDPARNLSSDFIQTAGRIIVPNQSLDPKNMPASFTEYMNAYANETGAEEITPENTIRAIQREQAQISLIGPGVKRYMELSL